ncbi:MAG: cell division protein FtsQ/DivIB [Burkholderiales bacterium]
MNSAAVTSNPLDLRLMQLGSTLLFALVLLLAAGAGLTWLARAPWLGFRQIRIEGEVMHNNATTIRANAVPKLHGSYLTLNLQQARTAFESVPWVRRAVVSKVWPQTLMVSLEEHRPAAYWERPDNEVGDDQLVNREGEVFEVNLGDVEDEDLPILRGPHGSAAQVLAMYRSLAPVFAARDEHIERLALSERGSWRAKLDSGSVIEIGRGSPQEVLERTQRFAASLPQVVNRFGVRQVEYADLRHSDGYAVRLAGVGTTDGKTTKNVARPGAVRPQR